MLILKQSISIDIRMGPFVDSVDGVSPETGITLAGADQAEVLKAGGLATVAMAGTFAAVSGADGWYDYTVAAGDVDTVGEVVFVVQDSSVCLPVYVRAYVVEEAVYDAMYGAASTGPLQGTTAGNTLDVNATGEAGLDLDNTSGTIAAAQIATDAITGAKIANAAIDANTFTSSAIVGATLDATAVDKIADQVWNEVRADHVAATTFGEGVASVIGSVASVTGAVGSVASGGVTAASLAVGAIEADAFAAGAIDAAALNADAVTKIRDGILPVQNVAFDNILFLFVAASDHVTPVTGATSMSAERSIDGGSFGAGTGTGPTEIANGFYQYDASQADMNGGKITFRFSATGGTPGAPDDTFVTVVTGAGV